MLADVASVSARADGRKLERNCTHGNVTRVNKIEAMYEVLRVKVEVDRGLSYTGPISKLTYVNFTSVRTRNLRDSRNPPHDKTEDRRYINKSEISVSLFFLLIYYFFNFKIVIRF